MKLPAGKSVLLFDMDGTLVATEPVGPATFVRQLGLYGVEPTDEERELFTRIWRRDGSDIRQDDWLPEIAEAYDIRLTAQAYLRQFYDMYLKEIIKAPALQGVENFLRQVKITNNFRTGLVTASKRTQVDAILDFHDWHQYFDEIITSEDISTHKPSPQPFLAALAKLGARPGDAVVFEDSKNGVLSGKAAGCYVVGIRAGNAVAQDLSHADVIADSFLDIN